MDTSFNKDCELLKEYFNIEPKKIMNSIYREDRHPSFGFYISKNGRLRWKDFATGENGSIIDLIRKVYNKDIRYEDIIPKKDYVQEYKNIKKSYTIINIEKKEFDNRDLDFWKQYYIDKSILDLYPVYSVSSFSIIKENNRKDYKAYGLCFAYVNNNNKIKIYKPKSTLKFISNMTNEDVMGLEYLTYSKSLIITKSFKDILVWRLFGYDAISFNSETSGIDYCVDIIKMLKNKYPFIFINYDYDGTGVQYANKLFSYLKGYIYKCIFTNDVNAKDISDYIRLYGYDKTKELVNCLIK